MSHSYTGCWFGHCICCRFYIKRFGCYLHKHTRKLFVGFLYVLSFLLLTYNVLSQSINTWQLFYHWHEQQIDGLYTSLLLVVYYFIGNVKFLSFVCPLFSLIYWSDCTGTVFTIERRLSICSQVYDKCLS